MLSFGLDHSVSDRLQGSRAELRGALVAGQFRGDPDRAANVRELPAGVIVVAAVSRGKDSKGRSTYSGDALTLASFRESSELEFGADDAFILVPDEDDTVVLRHLKARHSEAKDLMLQFDRRRQRFEAAEDQRTGKARKTPGKLQSALRSAWDRTPPAAEDADAFHGFEEFRDFA